MSRILLHPSIHSIRFCFGHPSNVGILGHFLRGWGSEDFTPTDLSWVELFYSVKYDLPVHPHDKQFLYQSGTLWYRRIMIRNATIFSSVTKNGASFVPRMEMPIPKMAMGALSYCIFRWDE